MQLRSSNPVHPLSEEIAQGFSNLLLECDAKVIEVRCLETVVGIEAP